MREDIKMAIELKTRKEMDKRYQWHLNDMIASDDEFEKLFAQAGKRVNDFALYTGHVADDPRKVIREYFAVSLEVERLIVFATMKRDEDGENSVYQGLAARAEALAVAAGAKSAFLKPELLALPKETLEEMKNDKAFDPYDAFLRSLLLDQPHTLPSEQEKLLAMAGEVLQTPHTAFTMLDNVDIPMPMVKNDEGEEVRLSHGKYQALIRSPKREVRGEAFRGMMNAYGNMASTVTALYAGSVKGDIFTAQARRFDSALAASLHPDEIPTAVYDNLLASVDAALPDLTRYLKLRAKALGTDELHMYDLYVPMVGDVEMKLEYEDAFALVKRALSPLGEEYQAVLQRAHDEGWIDVYENKAKRSGAYSWGCYGTHPYVLMNFEPGIDSASTLAHELGHSMHTYYSSLAQPYSKAEYSLFVAEVASTCNEVLLSKYLMNQFRDDKRTLAFLLNDLLESFRTTLFRQTMFAAFEKEAHAMAERGEALTKDTLSAMYKGLNEKYYGAGCVIDDEVAFEWMRIPHFYRAFYVYKYATGFSAAVALATRILKEGEPAVRDYKKFLSAGGSVPPIEALKFAGVDMSRPEPVREALRVFADTVTKLEELIG